MVSWNNDVLNMRIIHMSDQAILCLIEAINGDFTSFVTFIYAANYGIEIRQLWVDLNRHKQITSG